MAAAVAFVHASHDDLPKFAKTFGRESDRVKATIDRLNRVIQVLEGGDWIGEGATAFFNEMRSLVMPALVRLMKALEMGGTVTQQIDRVIEEIEQGTMSFFAAILVAFEGGAAGEGGGLGGLPGAAAGGGAGASTSDEKPSTGSGGGGGGGSGGGGGGGGGGAGSWDGEIGFRQEKPGSSAPGSASSSRRRSSG